MTSVSHTTRTFRLGTRGSRLALFQTDLVIQRLALIDPEVSLERVVVRTEGDIDKTSSLTVIGGRGVFTSALQTAILDGRVDGAVHSAKDLPTVRPVGLRLAAYPERLDPRDVVVSRDGLPLEYLVPRPRIGTSSRRRAVQIQSVRDDAQIVDLRGNIDTRLNRALQGDLDAIVIAAAGVLRMGWGDRIVEWLPLDRFVPSPGQGALVVESRESDETSRARLSAIDNPLVAAAVTIERAFLRAMGGGCTAPVGCFVEHVSDGWDLRAMLASDDGRRVEWACQRLGSQPMDEVADLARRMRQSVQGSTWAVAGGRDQREASGDHLAGVTVLVTRPADQAAPLIEALIRRGAVPIAAPMIRIQPADDQAAIDQAVHRLDEGRFDWLVLTSANATTRLLAAMDRLGVGVRPLAAIRIAAIGAATATPLRAREVSVSVVPDRSTADDFLATLVDRGIGGARVLFPHGDTAREVFPTGLRRAGAEVSTVTMYRTIAVPRLDPVVRTRIEQGAVDAAIFASPSSVHAFATLFGGWQSLAEAMIVCVGPTTAAAVESYGVEVAGIADDASLEGTIRALDGAVRRRTKRGAMADHDTSRSQLIGSAAGHHAEEWKA